MTDRRTILQTFTRIETENGGPFLADIKECARQAADELGTTYEAVREALLSENGGLFG